MMPTIARFAIFLLLSTSLQMVHAGERKPNFVIILADDMGYGDSSTYGGWIKTPNLDLLASEGLRFTDFHSSGNVCSPTRAGLLTGRYQQRAGIPGVVFAGENNPAHFAGLQPSEITLPELLVREGYSTALCGKWHLGYFPRYNPVEHGFGTFRGFISGNVDYHSHLDNQGREDWWNGMNLQPEAGYSTHLITRHATDFIRSHSGKPFFLMIAHEAVHDPYQGPNDPPLRESGKRKIKTSSRPAKEAYREMMIELDRSIADVRKALQETGLVDNTMVCFLSDNGATKMGSNGPLRGFKGGDWEGGHRVPAILSWPGRIRPGVTDECAISLDLMPTILEFAGIPAPKDRPLDGKSLKILALDQKSQGVRNLFWDGAMRQGPWKLVVQNGKPRLFNLEKDLPEAHDVADLQPDQMKSMLATWNSWKRDIIKDAPPQPKSLEEVSASN